MSRPTERRCGPRRCVACWPRTQQAPSAGGDQLNGGDRRRLADRASAGEFAEPRPHRDRGRRPARDRGGRRRDGSCSRAPYHARPAAFLNQCEQIGQGEHMAQVVAIAAAPIPTGSPMPDAAGPDGPAPTPVLRFGSRIVPARTGACAPGAGSSSRPATANGRCRLPRRYSADRRAAGLRLSTVNPGGELPAAMLGRTNGATVAGGRSCTLSSEHSASVADPGRARQAPGRPRRNAGQRGRAGAPPRVESG